ncbi:hypothetical protein EDD85DRAFT_789757 [Armillaria nabsnona]|nr:hypothetical protein EDD85DRAFT_789757 [Armillaria nabsnona]
MVEHASNENILLGVGDVNIALPRLKLSRRHLDRWRKRAMDSCTEDEWTGAIAEERCRGHLLRFGSWERRRKSSGQVIDPEKWVIPGGDGSHAREDLLADWENSNDAALLDLERQHEAKKLLGGVAPLALLSLLSRYFVPDPKGNARGTIKDRCDIGERTVLGSAKYGAKSKHVLSVCFLEGDTKIAESPHFEKYTAAVSSGKKNSRKCRSLHSRRRVGGTGLVDAAWEMGMGRRSQVSHDAVLLIDVLGCSRRLGGLWTSSVQGSDGTRRFSLFGVVNVFLGVGRDGSDCVAVPDRGGIAWDRVAGKGFVDIGLHCYDIGRLICPMHFQTANTETSAHLLVDRVFVEIGGLWRNVRTPRLFPQSRHWKPKPWRAWSGPIYRTLHTGTQDPGEICNPSWVHRATRTDEIVDKSLPETGRCHHQRARRFPNARLSDTSPEKSQHRRSLTKTMPDKPTTAR